MKKVSAIIVCCLLAVALIALPVFAAQTATFTVAANKTTVNPGDTITVTVSTTKLTACGTFGVTVLYDKDMFEPVDLSAKCLIPGMSGGDISVAGKVNFFFKALPAMIGGSPYTGEGDAFEVQLKVKDTAVGSSVLSMTAAQVEEDATAATATSTVTVKVNCDHVWGQWAPDGANHKRECTKGCGEYETKAHTFGNWTETTPAVCDTAGEKTRTCTVCSQPETAPINATGVHVWGNWEKVDDTDHKRTCTTCQDGTPAVETKGHTWGTASVTTPAGCDKAGEKTQTCTEATCGATKKTVIDPTDDHKFEGAWTMVNGTNHQRTCSTCEGTPAVETKAHTWSAWTETLKPDCKNPGEEKRTCTANCGAFETRPVLSTGDHNYNTWTKVDDQKHTAVCSGCGEFPVTKDHTWDNGTVKTPAGCDKAGVMLYTCTATGCGAEKEETIEATGNHTWGNWERVDATNHKRTCTTCQDGTPEVQTEAHNPSADLFSDADNHWNVCFCGEKMNVTAHVYDETKWAHDAEGHFRACECGAEKAGSRVAHTEGTEGTVTKKPTSKEYGEMTFYCTECKAPTRTERIDKVSTPNTGDNTLVIPMVILAVLSACGLAVTVVARKRASR